MNKPLIEYNWFKFYCENGIGIRVGDKTFYPPKRKVRRCNNCGFLLFDHLKPFCSMGIEIETVPSKKYKHKDDIIPKTICFPCVTRRTLSDAQEDGLSSSIALLCQKEDNNDTTITLDLYSQFNLDIDKKM